ncbi:YihY/virulence factor BrkB family protein [Antrihabitans stalactiti]|uniref:YihY/virulence factor BrkB family protein n=1 Tax=Antrihabitans stalactiti TaxID=2584121 RepID=A0A848KNM1_9NOCA|nr:YihY/virulence factor BrkB family protein [Antrihabitans stalactiti]NMN99548.1 YihY/virulence factor BrkB family protein [Antrihabitans stalactiti]
MVDWLDRFQRRFRFVGFPIAVIYKYVDDKGGYLAALITYYAFVSLFPILLLLTTILGVVLTDHPDLRDQLVESALHQFPVIGEQLAQPSELSGGGAGVAIGIAGALYGALGIGQAAQNAMDTVWSVPRNKRPNPILSRIRSVLLLLVLGAGLVATTFVSLLGGAFGALGGNTRIFFAIASVVVDIAIFLVAFRVFTARSVSFRDVIPGAVVAAVLWYLLQTFGAVYVARIVKTSSATNSVFAIVLGLLAFLYLASVTIVLCAEINPVRVDRLYPRALLTPFTDNVELTDGDKAAYTDQAKAQRAKGFERVEVHFDDQPS